MNDPPSTMLQRLQAGRLSDYTPVIGLAEKKEFHVYIRACRCQISAFARVGVAMNRREYSYGNRLRLRSRPGMTAALEHW